MQGRPQGQPQQDSVAKNAILSRSIFSLTRLLPYG